MDMTIATSGIDMSENLRLHVFVCTNQRDPSKTKECCADKNSLEIMTQIKRAARSSGIKDVRVNKSGCLNQCEKGVACVVYPQGVWYTIPKDERAVSEIVEHLAGGIIAEKYLMGE
ncbi:MAG: (2Fe-2S) ferredoxin domain-containing protein [Euryarchaeota archaeon]|jgi:(2Fe-2S) ferredoxin|nr:(2Fe-2S) ferredoxin domain-containing protein [Euryarchaeota archaeon]